MLNLIWLWAWSEYRGFPPFRCLYSFHTRVCSQTISGGDLCHTGTSKSMWNKSMDWLLYDAVFTERSFQTDYDTSFLWEWKIYCSLVFQHKGKCCQVIPRLAIGVWRVSWNSLLCHIYTHMSSIQSGSIKNISPPETCFGLRVLKDFNFV